LILHTYSRYIIISTSNLHSKIINRYNSLAISSYLSCKNNLKYSNISPDDTLLDLGCGSRKNLFDVINIIGPAGRAIGIDISLEMIDKDGNIIKKFVGSITKEDSFNLLQ